MTLARWCLFLLAHSCAFWSAGCSGATMVCLDGSLTEIDGDAVQWAEGGLGLWSRAGVPMGLTCEGPDVLVRTWRSNSAAQSHALDRWPAVDLVELDPAAQWSERGVRRAVAHEFGHILGLGHVADEQAVMFEAPTADELSSADLVELCEEAGVCG